MIATHVEDLMYASFSAEGPYDIPPRMTSEDWEKFQESLLSTDQFGQAQTARLWEEYLLPKYPDSGFFLLRVGDVRRAFGCMALALEAYEEAQRVEGVGADPIFDLFIIAFKKRCDQAEEDQMFAWADQAAAHYWKPMHVLTFPASSEPNTDSLRKRWQALKARLHPEGIEGSGEEMYYRTFAIESNLLDNVVAISPDSVAELVKTGLSFSNPLIAPPPEHAHTVTPNFGSDEMALILQDSRAALDMLLSLSQSGGSYTREFLCQLHQLCMERSKFRTTYAKLPSGSLVNVKTKYMPTGRTRGASKANITKNAYTGTIQFCPFEEVDIEMDRFVQISEQFAYEYVHRPFALAAWTHFAFITMHPFQGANGRMSRLLASRSVVRTGLPPICVPSHMKGSYIAALNHIRVAEDDPTRYEPLIAVFISGMLETLSAIESILE